MIIKTSFLRKYHFHAGFSMIEVLITMLIISLAILGTAGMQSYAMKLNKGADFRSQAVMLASDLAERIEANKAGAISGAYQYTCPAIPAAISTACGPSGAACIASSLATYDLLEWRAQVASTLPQSACSVNLTTAGNPSIYSISITWVDRQSDVAYDASIVSQSGAGELLTYQTTRTVFN